MVWPIVAFPVIGHRIPPPGNEEEFTNTIVRFPPHWIYHLQIEHAVTNTNHEIPGHLDREGIHSFRAVSTNLFKSGFKLHGAVRMTAREFVHPDYPQIPYAFAVPSQTDFRSGHLAFAIGLAAAATRRPLPCHMLFSGALAVSESGSFTPDLVLSQLDKTWDKAMLCLGQAPGYQVGPVLDEYYKPGASKEAVLQRLGPRAERMESGNTKMLVVPEKLNVGPKDFEEPLEAYPVPPAEVERLTAAFHQYVDRGGNAEREAVNALIQDLSPGDCVLVVQVPTVYAAARFLGYDRVAARHPLTGGIQIHRVVYRPKTVKRTPTSDAPIDVTQVAVANMTADWSKMWRKRKSPQSPHISDRLHGWLCSCARMLKLDHGFVALTHRDPRWLRVMAWLCPKKDRLPHYLPSHAAVVSDVLSQGCSVVGRANAATAPPPGEPPGARAGGESRVVADYETFLGSLHSYAAVPLRVGTKVVGVLFLGRKSRPGGGQVLPDERKVRKLEEGALTVCNRDIAPFLEEEAAIARDLPLGAGSRPVDRPEAELEILGQTVAGSKFALIWADSRSGDLRLLLMGAGSKMVELPTYSGPGILDLCQELAADRGKRGRDVVLEEFRANLPQMYRQDLDGLDLVPISVSPDGRPVQFLLGLNALQADPDRVLDGLKPRLTDLARLLV
jgi:hypothetical protein